MRKKLIFIVIGICVIVVSFFSFRLFSKKTQPIELTTEKVGRATISNTVTATGTLEATITVEVGTQVSGQISNIYVDNNSVVKKGQLIAKLDEQTLRSSLEQSKATLDQAEAEYDYQKSNYERYKKLIEKKLIAQKDFDEVEYSYKTALASLNSAKASYNKNKTNLDYAYIYSPIDGVVLERDVEEGETVAASYSTPTLFTIANDLTQMQIEADVDEADIGQLKVGQRVEFTVDAFPDKKFDGKVIEIRLMPVESSNVVTYTVVIDAPNPDKSLIPGMTANVTFYVTEKKNILVVSYKAFEFKPDMEALHAYAEEHPKISLKMPDRLPFSNDSDSTKLVWVKTNSNITPQTITIGETDEINYELISGLDEGDELILSMTSSSNQEGGFEGSPQSEEGAARSPFMPGPPGSDRDKKK